MYPQESPETLEFACPGSAADTYRCRGAGFGVKAPYAPRGNVTLIAPSFIRSFLAQCQGWTAGYAGVRPSTHWSDAPVKHAARRREEACTAKEALKSDSPAQTRGSSWPRRQALIADQQKV